MNRKKKIEWIVIAASIPLMALLGKYSYDVFVVMVPNLVRLDTLFRFYLKENQGCFPESLDSWIESGYLKKGFINERETYYLKGEKYSEDDKENLWHEIPYFASFDFAYGVKCEDIEKVNGKLYKKDTGEPILLVTGPANKIHRDIYENFSCKWYDVMCEYKE